MGHGVVVETHLRKPMKGVRRADTSSTAKDGWNLQRSFVEPNDAETRRILSNHEFADTIIRRMNTPSKGIDFDEALEG